MLHNFGTGDSYFSMILENTIIEWCRFFLEFFVFLVPPHFPFPCKRHFTNCWTQYYWANNSGKTMILSWRTHYVGIRSDFFPIRNESYDGLWLSELTAANGVSRDWMKWNWCEQNMHTMPIIIYSVNNCQ